MHRAIGLALLCVSLTAAPAAAKKKHPPPHAKKSSVRRPQALALRAPKARPLVRIERTTPPPRVAASVERPAAASPPQVTAPPPAPVAHVLGPQAGDDEVPGSRMKR